MPPSTILLATDLSCRCDRALDRAAQLAAEWSAKLVVVHALEQPQPVSNAPSWRSTDDPRSIAKRRIAADLSHARSLDLHLVVERGEPTQLVLQTAAERGADLIITGVARDETLGRAVLGNTVETLVRRSSVPVLVVKARTRGPYRNVVVASDFSECARKALVTAVAMYPSAFTRVFHAYDVLYEGFIDDKMAARESAGARARGEAREFLAATTLPPDRRISTLCEYGPPVALLSDLVQSGDVDLVVAGTRGRGRIATLLLGSVASELLAHLPGDVMVVPPPAE